MSESSAIPSSEPAPWVITAERRDGFRARAAEVWQYRRILLFFALKSIQQLYAGTHLGVMWIFIRTLLPLVIGSFVFSTVMEVPSGSVPYFVFFLAGQIPWNFFDGPLIRGSRGLEVNRQLLGKVYVPRVILPLGHMAAGIIEPLIITAVLLGALVYYWNADGVWHVQAGWRLLASAAAVIVILVFAFALTLWTSIWQARARDMRFVLRYVVSFWMYFTPVIYPLSIVPPEVRRFMQLNPLTAPVETFKWGILAGWEHSWGWFGYSIAVTGILFGAGIWHFARTESVTLDRL
jgi:lipopolysaccharide transport system permease protein